MLPEAASVLDLGCGNGVDTALLGAHGRRAYGVDVSAEAIHNAGALNAAGCRFRRESALWTLAEFRYFDVIYARWLLHAMLPLEAAMLLKLAAATLGPGGILAIEARSANGEHPDDHMRWPVDPDVLQERLERLGLTVESLSESRDYSPMGDDRPLLVRCIARLEIEDSRRGADDAAPVLGRVAGDGPPASEARSWSC